MEEKIKNSVEKVKKRITPCRIGRKKWHSKEWKEKKKELEKEMKKQEMEEIIRAIRTEEEAWKYINKYRKRRERIDESIEMEKWFEHFMNLLEGSEEGIVNTEEEKMEKEEEEVKEKKEEEEEDKITKEEIILQLRRLKKGRAPGENGIENEAWRLMSKEIEEVLIELIKIIWREEAIPAKWNKGVISPIYKKGEKNKMKNYRGVILMDTAYKIYANILNIKERR